MITIPIPVNGRFDGDHILQVLAAHAIPGAEIHDAAARQHTRILKLTGEFYATTVAIGITTIMATVDSDDPDVAVQAAAAVRAWLDLDTDLEPVRKAFRTDTVLAPRVAQRPHLRIVGYPDGFEAVVMAVIGQQVSLAAGRTFGGRLVAAFGRPQSDALVRFPTPHDLSRLSADQIGEQVGLTRSRSNTVVEVARAFADGLTLGGQTGERMRSRLLAIPGIGPWTADYVGVRAVGDRDAFAAGDLILRRALGGITAKAASARAEAWRPYRAYALTHLWAYATNPQADPIR